MVATTTRRLTARQCSLVWDLTGGKPACELTGIGKSSVHHSQRDHFSKKSQSVWFVIAEPMAHPSEGYLMGEPAWSPMMGNLVICLTSIIHKKEKWIDEASYPVLEACINTLDGPRILIP